MGKSIPAIVTPEVLSWARGLDKITVAEIAKKIKVDTAKVLAWEAGSEYPTLGQFTRNYTQTVKRAADNKRRYAPGEGSIPPVLLSGVSKGVPPLAHDFACKV